jgi:hypothetical protein
VTSLLLLRLSSGRSIAGIVGWSAETVLPRRTDNRKHAALSIRFNEVCQPEPAGRKFGSTRELSDFPQK